MNRNSMLKNINTAKKRWCYTVLDYCSNSVKTKSWRKPESNTAQMEKKTLFLDGLLVDENGKGLWNMLEVDVTLKYRFHHQRYTY